MSLKLKDMNLPPMPAPDLLVDCAQSMVHGLTVSKAEAWGAACYAAGMQAAADICRKHAAMTWWTNEARDLADMIDEAIRAAIDKS